MATQHAPCSSARTAQSPRGCGRCPVEAVVVVVWCWREWSHGTNPPNPPGPSLHKPCRGPEPTHRGGDQQQAVDLFLAVHAAQALLGDPEHIFQRLRGVVVVGGYGTGERAAGPLNNSTRSQERSGGGLTRALPGKPPGGNEGLANGEWAAESLHLHHGVRAPPLASKRGRGGGQEGARRGTEMTYRSDPKVFTRKLNNYGPEVSNFWSS
jgi:hypothetical protein